MRKVLDKLFENKKLAFWLPIILAVLVYLSFLIFGTAENKNELLIGTLIAALFWYFALFLIVFAQVKNSKCPERLLDFFELLAVVLFTLYGIVGAITFVAGGFQNFSPIPCAGIVSYSSLSWAHSKRKKKIDG